ncbi:DUF4302 domain-containing protein [Dyadobacter sp. NIV53]|uniref:DUF4302 domain-containing protein n=1 Tax=Dyadobacter sp. NIV53 TaxID=2861765 RepID=UPI001C88449E|nr:DUF4302 domain-containing protein [Dyadobacter sp. NIV53]
MKKTFSIVLPFLLFVVLISCKTEDSVFEQTSNERVNASVEKYQKQLIEAEYGWKGAIYPGTGGVYSFYFKFNDQNRVVMYSDFNKEAAVTSKESSYLVKSLQSPSLIFDTYSYLHLLADPEGIVNGGVYGEGLKSDFEFSFGSDTLNNGTLTLTGTKNRTRLVLNKASQEEAVAYGNGGLAKSLLFSNIDLYPIYFKRVTIGGVTYEINVNTAARTITLSWLEGTTSKSFTTEYYHSSTGVAFITPFVNGLLTLNSLTNLTWDASKLSLGFTAGTANVTVVGAAKPLIVDIAAPKRFRQFVIDKGSYWISETGFNVGGKEDYFGITKIPDFYYMLFFPDIASSQGTTYDAFTAYDQTNLMGPAVVPSYTSDGRIIFSILGTYGTNTLMNTTVADQIEDASGYYLVQTSPIRYDMVSAKDAKTWISWWYPF